MNPCLGRRTTISMGIEWFTWGVVCIDTWNLMKEILKSMIVCIAVVECGEASPSRGEPQWTDGRLVSPARKG